jgi:dolichyl-phosphate-mannose--protein O-mannosyl transferase
VARIVTEGASGVPPERPPSSPRWTRAEIVLLLLLVLAGGFLRFNDLGDPGEQIFDEVYYAVDACGYVGTAEECDISEAQNEVHPPFGKWLIGAGIQLFGYDAFGYRVASALAGALTVGLLFALGRRLLNSVVGAGLAAGLLAIDFLHIVQSRISMLDIFVPLFAVAALLFLVIDRDQVLARVADGEAARNLVLGRPWRAAAGAMSGAAVATKWSGGLVLLAVLVIACAWEVSARRRAGVSRPGRVAFTEAGANVALYLLLIPVAVYVLSYVGRLDGGVLALPWSDGSWVRAFVAEQKEMFDFHSALDATHHYQSPAWSWLTLRRPVAYFYDDLGDGNVQEIMAFGSPFVWWASVGALLLVLYQWLRKRDMFAPEGVILAGFAFSYLPWTLPYFARDAMFIFYLLPSVPFMCLALGYALTRIGWSWEARAAQALFIVGALVAFFYFKPLLYKSTISRETWDSRIWFDDRGCDRPEGTPTQTTVTEVVQGQETEVVKETNDNSSLPPKGWCWI